MKVRSPVLGYNHNVRYADRLWHVQTEDSGYQNPHLFTHLFHEGTILATKRLDYDPTSEVIVVQKLMQAQHKSMLRELKAGAFDEKISKYLGEPIVRKESAPSANPDATPSGVELAEPRPLEGPIEHFEEPPTDRTSVPSLDTDRNLAATPATDRKLTVPPESKPNLTPLRPTGPPTGNPPPLPPLRPPVRPTVQNLTAQKARPPSSVAMPRQPAGIGGRRPSTGATAYGGSKPTAEGVVVARPAVIIGGENVRRTDAPPRKTGEPATRTSGSRWHPPTAPSNPPPAQPPQEKGAQDNIFGGDLISEKSLDEVILAYLSEDLNEK